MFENRRRINTKHGSRPLIMKPVRINIYKLTYTIDLPVLLLFVAVSIDIISTTLFVSLGAGVEKNPILGKLIDISIWFIPVYLLVADAVFIPFLSNTLRKTFSYAFAFISIVLAVNNFSLIFFDSAFLIDTIGFNGTVILLILFSLAIFAYFLLKENTGKHDVLYTCLKFILFILFIILIHFLFFVITWFAF